jgi:uncharacterized protein YyaL (SSP411 family)
VSAADVHHTNRLARETSPYLLQHQHNPVDWYPWGEEAFDAARRLSRPIFLSVGYSTCYWCHVMERQCFENEAIAKEMNDRFVNIKVDREERPDVDQLYMTAVQVLTRHGGWPMSVFLTPELKPFYGGTYFPPEDAHGRPGFPTILRAISEAFHDRRDEVEKSADQLVSILEQLAEPPRAPGTLTIDESFIERLVEQSVADYEPQFGGFGSAPKFPRETLLEMLLEHQRRHPHPTRAKMIRHTLDAMANGGIRDHLGGGFHRYSTDAKWLVPHFEVMLYDNAMLGWCYVEAHRQFQEKRYASVARGIFDFVLREMTSPDGAFYTAFDAEVDAQEGLSYLWTRGEVEELLHKGDCPLFLRMYGLDRGPNFADPHHGSGVPDKNILYLPEGSEREDEPAIVQMRRILYEARQQRKQPLLDTKVLTSWNALMIRALAHAGTVLPEPRYLQSASRAARFVLERHRTDAGELWRVPGKIAGFLDDYAFLAQALLALHQADGNGAWREAADSLGSTMRQRFGDERADGGDFFFSAANSPDLVVRQKIGSDSPLPSGNAVAAMVMLEVDEPDTARRAIETFAGQLDHDAGMSATIQAAMRYVERFGAITVEPRATARADRPLSPHQLAASVVQLSASWLDTSTLQIRVQVLTGFHVHANQTLSNLVPTRLTVPERDDVRIDYPPGQQRSFAFAEQPIVIYEGVVPITVRFARPLPSDAPIRMSLTYQACDETACLPQVTKEFGVQPAPARGV